MVLGLVIPAEETTATEMRQFANLEDYQAAVEGWVEPIEIPALGICLYVNEQGKVRDLPLNARATFLWWFHVLEARQRSVIVGDVVVVGVAKTGGVAKDVPVELQVMYDVKSRFAVDFRAPKATEWTRYPGDYNYSDAAVWAMLIADKSPSPLEVRVVTSNR